MTFTFPKGQKKDLSDTFEKIRQKFLFNPAIVRNGEGVGQKNN
jgi:hypothetical protein